LDLKAPRAIRALRGLRAYREREDQLGPPSLDLRVGIERGRAMCEASEILISAYCVDGIGALHIVGTTGATCDGDPGAKAVVVCARR
jgi:hypothetical protein